MGDMDIFRSDMPEPAIPESEIPRLMEEAEYLNLTDVGDSVILTPAALFERDTVHGPALYCLAADEDGWPIQFVVTYGMRRIRRMIGQPVKVTLSGMDQTSKGFHVKRYDISPA